MKFDLALHADLLVSWTIGRASRANADVWAGSSLVIVA